MQPADMPPQSATLPTGPRQNPGQPGSPSRPFRRIRNVPGVDLSRLGEAIKGSRKSLEKYRTKRVEAVKQFAGSNWSDNAAQQPVFLNLLAVYVQVMSRALVAKNPTVMLSTFDDSAKAVVSKMESWVKDEMDAMDFASIMQRAAVDGFFSMAVAKVALADPADAALSAWDLSAGEPFVSLVSLDDFAVDLYAKSWDQVSWVGHRYRVPVEVAQAIHSKSTIAFQESETTDYNAEGDQRLNFIGRGTTGQDEFEESVDLWEIYLPRHKLVVTFLDDHGSPDIKAIVRVQKWIGPARGPYHMLGFGPVPDNLVPKAPMHDLIDLHLAINRTLRKVVRQTDNFKKILPIRGGAMDDAGVVKQASDGEMVACDNPDQMREIAFGGPDANLLLVIEKFKEMFNFVAGNMDILGGRAAGSRTATQDKLLNENASAGVADMQETMIQFVTSVLEALLWFWWNHPKKSMQTSYAPKSMPEFKQTRTLTPQDRQKTPMPRIKIDPYSVAHSTPQARLQFLNSVVQTIQPFMPLLQQQGIMFDVNAYLSRVSRYGDEPDLGDIFQFQNMPNDPQPARGGQDAGSSMPASTSREYVRRSAGGSPADQQQQGNVQLQQMASDQAQQGGQS